MAKTTLKWAVGIFVGLAVLGALVGEESSDENSEEASEQSAGPSAREQQRRQDDADRNEAGRSSGGAAGNFTRVTEVIDGDTVDTDELGRVSLIGVDTPEQGSCYDNAATRFTEQRIGGRVVRYELGVERTDPYGRTLAYLYRGGMHNLALLEEGYAEVLMMPPNDKYLRDFEQAETDARRTDAGRWSACEEPAPEVPAPAPPAPEPEQ